MSLAILLAATVAATPAACPPIFGDTMERSEPYIVSELARQGGDFPFTELAGSLEPGRAAEIAPEVDADLAVIRRALPLSEPGCVRDSFAARIKTETDISLALRAKMDADAHAEAIRQTIQDAIDRAQEKK